MTAILHEITIHLRFNVLDALRVGFQPRNINLDVKMSDIWCGCQLMLEARVAVLHTADDSIILHLLEVHSSKDISTACGRNENLTFFSSFLHCRDLIP